MGLSMPQTKHMLELGCLSMMLPPYAAGIVAPTRGLDKRLRGQAQDVWLLGKLLIHGMNFGY
jgi:hypothetical protein